MTTTENTATLYTTDPAPFGPLTASDAGMAAWLKEATFASSRLPVSTIARFSAMSGRFLGYGTVVETSPIYDERSGTLVDYMITVWYVKDGEIGYADYDGDDYARRWRIALDSTD